MARIHVPMRITGELCPIVVTSIWRVDDVPRAFPPYSAVRLWGGGTIETAWTKAQVRKAVNEAVARQKAEDEILAREQEEVRAAKKARAELKRAGVKSQTRSPYISPLAKQEVIRVVGTAADLILAKHIRTVARTHNYACPARAVAGYISSFAKAHGDDEYRRFVMQLLRDTADGLEKFNEKKEKQSGKRGKANDRSGNVGDDIQTE